MDADIMAMHADGTIAGFLKSYGLDPSGADVGPPRLVQ
jgi:polar amino acid transport system substrate-binding protein